MNKFEYKVQGVDYEVEIEEMEGNIAKVSVNGIPFEVELKQPINPAKAISRPKVAAPAPAPAAAPAARPAVPAASAGAGTAVKAPLPGTITTVNVKVGDKVNVERSMVMNGRLDGHIVQGHVDETAKCIAMKDADGSTYFTFEYELNKEMARKGYFTVDKGSVTVNGVSLTVCDPTDNTFTVAIIPYTRENTNFCDIKVGTVVNIEFDILGKYIARLKSFE